MVFDKIKDIIVEQLDVEEDAVTMEAVFLDVSLFEGHISLIYIFGGLIITAASITTAATAARQSPITKALFSPNTKPPALQYYRYHYSLFSHFCQPTAKHTKSMGIFSVAFTISTILLTFT